MAADPPSWEFEISGKVIEVAEAEGAAAAAAPSAAAQSATGVSAALPVNKGPPMTSCLRRLTIRLDQQLYPHDGLITWTKALHEGPHKEKFSVRWTLNSVTVHPKVFFNCLEYVLYNWN